REEVYPLPGLLPYARISGRKNVFATCRGPYLGKTLARRRRETGGGGLHSETAETDDSGRKIERCQIYRGSFVLFCIPCKQALTCEKPLIFDYLRISGVRNLT